MSAEIADIKGCSLEGGVAVNVQASATKTALARVLTCLSRLFRVGRLASSRRQLHLCETLALGDKRFVAVIEFQEQKLLIGGTSSSLTMLARLPNQEYGPATESAQQKRKG
jgi:flagellar biogenesis protein FliO